MALRDLSLIIMISTLTCIGLYYAYRFWKIGNEILSMEWFLIGFSALCFFLYAIGVSKYSIQVTIFMDLFSRLIGMPILGLIGMMQLTHRVHLSLRNELILFAVSMLVGAVILYGGLMKSVLPMAYVVVGVVFDIYLLYFTRLLFKYRLTGHGVAVLVMIALNFFVMLLQDYVRLPQEDTSVFINKMFIEHVVWSFTFVEMFYAYYALSKVMPEGGGSKGYQVA